MKCLFIITILILMTSVYSEENTTTTTLENTTNATRYIPPGMIIIDDSKCPNDNMTSCSDFEVFIDFTDIVFQDRFFQELPWKGGSQECSYTDSENLASGRWKCTTTFPYGMWNISKNEMNIMPQSVIDTYENIYTKIIDDKNRENKKLRVYAWLLFLIVLILIVTIYLIVKVIPNTLIYMG